MKSKRFHDFYCCKLIIYRLVIIVGFYLFCNNKNRARYPVSIINIFTYDLFGWVPSFLKKVCVFMKKPSVVLPYFTHPVQCIEKIFYLLDRHLKPDKKHIVLLCCMYMWRVLVFSKKIKGKFVKYCLSYVHIINTLKIRSTLVSVTSKFAWAVNCISSKNV